MQVTSDLKDKKRKGFWFDSLIHAREWIAGTSIMNMIHHVR